MAQATRFAIAVVTIVAMFDNPNLVNCQQVQYADLTSEVWFSKAKKEWIAFGKENSISKTGHAISFVYAIKFAAGVFQRSAPISVPAATHIIRLGDSDKFVGWLSREHSTELWRGTLVGNEIIETSRTSDVRELGIDRELIGVTAMGSVAAFSKDICGIRLQLSEQIRPQIRHMELVPTRNRGLEKSAVESQKLVGMWPPTAQQSNVHDSVFFMFSSVQGETTVFDISALESGEAQHAIEFGGDELETLQENGKRLVDKVDLSFYYNTSVAEISADKSLLVRAICNSSNDYVVVEAWDVPSNRLLLSVNKWLDLFTGPPEVLGSGCRICLDGRNIFVATPTEIFRFEWQNNRFVNRYPIRYRPKSLKYADVLDAKLVDGSLVVVRQGNRGNEKGNLEFSVVPIIQ